MISEQIVVLEIKRKQTFKNATETAYGFDNAARLKDVQLGQYVFYSMSFDPILTTSFKVHKYIICLNVIPNKYINAWSDVTRI